MITITPNGLDVTPDLLDDLAKIARGAFNDYAVETLPKPPSDFTKGWEQTGEWGRNANRAVAKAVMKRFAEITGIPLNETIETDDVRTNST